MHKNYSLTTAARNDIGLIIKRIYLENPEAAKIVKTKFFDVFYNLGNNPNLGTKREELTKQDVKFWHIYSYSIVYDYKATPISILRILSSYRDIKNILR